MVRGADAALRLALAGVVVLAVGGCVIRVGEIQEHDVTVGDEGAETVVAEFRATSADLEIEGGASDVMEALFRYNTERLEPEVDYSVSGDEGRLVVTQPRVGFFTIGSDSVNEWLIELGDELPTEVVVDLSSGNAEIDFDRVDVVKADLSASSGNIVAAFGGDHDSLERVLAEASSGQVTLEFTGEFGELRDVVASASSGSVRVDLTGTWTEDVDFDVSASSGQITVIVPDGVNVEIRAQTSSGNVSADGFTIDGDDYVLEGPRGAPTLRIKADVSSGNIRLEVE